MTFTIHDSHGLVFQSDDYATARDEAAAIAGNAYAQLEAAGALDVGSHGLAEHLGHQEVRGNAPMHAIIFEAFDSLRRATR